MHQDTGSAFEGDEETGAVYMTYADALTAEIVAVSDDMLGARDDVVVWVEVHGLSAPAGWVEQCTLDALGEAGVTDAFLLDHSRRVTEWGASGVAETILVTLGQGVFVQAAVAVAADLGRRLVRRARSAHDAPAMSEADAEDWARARVAIKYDLEVVTLRTTRVTDAPGGLYTIALSGPDGTNYELRFHGAGAGVTVLECTRTLPAGTA